MCTRVQLLCSTKKVILCLASFFYRLANAVNFFFSRILSLLFCPILIHSINKKKKKEREKEPMALLPRVTYIYIYIYTLLAGREEKNDLILVLHTCALSFFSYTFRNDEKGTEGNSLLYYSI
jgi:hypothetical protein